MEIAFSLGTLLKVNHEFEWLQDHQQTFDIVKRALTVIALQPRKPLRQYFTSISQSIGTLVV